MKQLSQSNLVVTGDVLRADSLTLFEAWTQKLAGS